MAPVGSERGIPCSAAGLQIWQDQGLLDPIVTEANEKVLSYVSFPLDPKFEASALKATNRRRLLGCDGRLELRRLRHRRGPPTC